MRYPSTLLAFWSSSLAAEMEYRMNFVLAAVTSAGNLAGAVFSMGLFYQHGYELGGWTWPQVLLVIGFYTILEGVQATLLVPNFQRFSEYVREGTLDYVLLKPMDSQFLLSFRNVSVWGVPNVVLGLALVGYGAAIHEPVPGPGSLALGLVPLALGVIVLYCLSFMLATLTIWFVKLWNMTIALRSLLEAGRYPVQAYPRIYRIVFTYVVPVAFLTTVPAEAMTGRSTPVWLGAALSLALGLLAGSRVFWRFALRYYTSASS